MNKAKVTIFNGKDMVRKTNYADMKVCREMDTQDFIFKDELRLIRIGWQNCGCYLELEGSKGNKLYMSHSQFNDLLESKDVKIYGEFEFLKQGTVQSIGLIKVNDLSGNGDSIKKTGEGSLDADSTCQ